MPLKLYLLRNGETEDCKARRYCSRDGISLTPRGEAMAGWFAESYQTLHWTAIFSSPLNHALAMLKPLCGALKTSMPDIQTRDGLRELNFGNWEGFSADEVNQKFHDDYMRWLADPAWNAPTGGEKGIRVARRSSAVLTEIEDRYPSGNVLIVSHKGTLRIMLCSLLGVDVGRYRDRLTLPVASLTVVSIAGYGPFVEALNDFTYLPPDLRPKLPG